MKKHWVFAASSLVWATVTVFDYVAGADAMMLSRDVLIFLFALFSAHFMRDEWRARMQLNEVRDGRWLIWNLEENAWMKPRGEGHTSNVRIAGRFNFVSATQIVLVANAGCYPNWPRKAMIRDEA